MIIDTTILDIEQFSLEELGKSVQDNIQLILK